MKTATFQRVCLLAYLGLAGPGLLTPLHAQAPALVLTSTTPPAQAIGVPTGTTVAASFSQPLGSYSATALSVFSQQGGRKAGTGLVNGNTITFAPTTPFRAGETLWATLTVSVYSINLVSSAKPYVWQFTTATRPSAGTFSGNQEVALGGLPTSVSLGDVDGDGDLDMLTTQNGKLTILANNGQGTFEDKGLAALNFNEPVPIRGHILADLDRDGDLDVIIRGSGSTGAGALDVGFNDGHGTFTGGNGHMLSLDVVPREFTVGDVDGNGLLDLLVATSSGKVKVYLNYGLSPITLTSLPDLSVGAVPTTLTLGDVDNDGDLDLVTGKADNTVLISYNDGSGSFSNSSTVSSNNPSQAVLGDVDSDGDLDLVVANGNGRSGSTVSIHLNAGKGTFGTATTLGVSAAPLSLALGDVDGDGDLDLVTANYDNSTASVRLNNGQGSFGNGREVAVGSSPVQVALGDVDGDGTLDLVTANQASSTASVRFNQATTTTPGAWYTLTPTAGQVIPREETAYVAAGDQFYLLGGRSIMPVQAYAPKQQTWTNKAAPPIELHHFQAVELNGLIYAAGAFTGGYPHEQPVAQVYLYNPVADQWLTGATIPAARRRGSAGAVAYNGKLYVVGGLQDGHWSGWVPWFDEYDPATNTWRTLPNAPRARDHFQAALRQGKLYLVGGRRSSASTGEVFNLTIPEVDVFDFATGQWSTLPSTANLPTPRAGAGAAFLGDELVVTGGESAQPTGHQETEALDVTRNTWRRLANLQQGRHGIQAIANNGGLYVVAGAGNQGGSPLLGSQEAYFPGAPTAPTGTALTASSLVAPATVSFSATNSSETAQNITLRNSGGNQDILLTSADLSGTGATAFRYRLPYPLPFVLPAGQSISMQVSYLPTAGSQSATLRLGHSGTGGATTVSLLGNSQGSSTSASALRIRAGGGALATSLGTFAADQYYAPTPGNAYTTTASIAGTPNQELYQTERYSSNGALAYAIPVPSGQYTVVLHFAEIYWQQAGQRIFDVSLEGQKVLDNYDIVQKVGSFTATTETFTTTVSDGVLNLDFSALASDGGRDQAKISAIEVLPTPTTSTLPTSYRLRAGGGDLTTTRGVFAADQGYAPTPGNTYATTAAIAGTSDAALYQTERYGTTGQFQYALPLAPGTYTVVLHFAEIYWQQAGQRIFDVSLEGQKVLDNYDIVQKVGPFTATTETFTTTVSDGVLNLDFSSLASDGGRDQPKLSALEVRPLNSSAATARTLASAPAPALSPATGTWEVYPNPASGQVTLSFPSAKAQLATLALTDALGRTVLRREMQVPAGSTSLPVSLAQVSEGLYQLTLYLADGQRWQQKLLVHP